MATPEAKSGITACSRFLTAGRVLIAQEDVESWNTKVAQLRRSADEQCGSEELLEKVADARGSLEPFLKVGLRAVAWQALCMSDHRDVQLELASLYCVGPIHQTQHSTPAYRR